MPQFLHLKSNSMDMNFIYSPAHKKFSLSSQVKYFISHTSENVRSRLMGKEIPSAKVVQRSWGLYVVPRHEKVSY